ncbi:MAG: prepilin-type N-terminal cleavage/methylation domain-containing protein [Marinospirillum sp.]|uniref:pilus assembly FimT family protein n=1 Tax=Marinospirillum sp. TaxID=2183934 RepID=UPI001A0D3E9F|nr:GspH/FimT family pseudopilin [Marinospirillum sp.]MBE0505728.1 prepilin-type N-terminal cleavage/methylation domain-containing protein [Marinospirillum sp.]
MPRKTTSAGVTQQQGFTLLELLMVLGLIAIIVGVAMPAGQAMIERGRLTAITNEVYGALLYTRNEATRLRRNYRLCFVSSSTATACSTTATSRLGVFAVTGSTLTLSRVFDLTPSTELEFFGVTDRQLNFHGLGNRQVAADNATVYLQTTAGSRNKQVEVCFNGRIVIRETNDSSECQ